MLPLHHGPVSSRSTHRAWCCLNPLHHSQYVNALPGISSLLPLLPHPVMTRTVCQPGMRLNSDFPPHRAQYAWLSSRETQGFRFVVTWLRRQDSHLLTAASVPPARLLHILLNVVLRSIRRILRFFASFTLWSTNVAPTIRFRLSVTVRTDESQVVLGIVHHT